MITANQAARMIDISAVRTQHSRKDIEELAEYGKKYRFINLHVLPNWVSTMRELLKDTPDVLVGSPVGFPSGAHRTDVKLYEAEQLLKDGVQEMDIVMNVGRFRSGEYEYVEDELMKIISMVDHRIPTKVIIEICTLTDDQMLKAADLVIDAGADFVKTGTGWVSSDPSLERIRKLKEHCGNRIKVKAAGGIRTADQFCELVDMGVERVGINTNSAISILKSLDERSH